MRSTHAAGARFAGAIYQSQSVKTASRNLQISRKRIRLSRQLQPQSPLLGRPASTSVRGFDAFAFNDFISQDAALLLEQINQQKLLFVDGAF